jgi:hypothetical protein
MRSTAHEDPGGGSQPSATLGDSGEKQLSPNKEVTFMHLSTRLG